MPSKSSKAKSVKRIKLSSVQALANRYARERDCFGNVGTACISCGLWFNFDKLDGGHFIPATRSALRFDERNINAQCHRCNRFLHGNTRPYLKGMLQKYGSDVVNDLEARESLTKKWTQDELREQREYYKGKLAELRSGTAPDLPAPISMSQLWAPFPLSDGV